MGEAFCNAIIEKAGIEALMRVWEGPDALPTLVEIREPQRWLARQGVAQLA